MKKITKILSVFAISSALAVSFGCASYTPLAGTNNTAAKEDFTVLGRFEKEFKTKDAAFSKLFAEAKKQYPEADDIVNFLIDEKTSGGNKYYVMSALVIKYNK